MSGFELEEPEAQVRYHKHVRVVRDHRGSRRTDFELLLVEDLRDGEARGARYLTAPGSMIRRLGDALWRGGGGGSMLYPNGSRGAPQAGGGRQTATALRCARASSHRVLHCEPCCAPSSYPI